MGKREIVLLTIDDEVFYQLAEGYVLHLVSKEVCATLLPSQLVLLVDLTIQAHQTQAVI